jgi:hypothetical protein
MKRWEVKIDRAINPDPVLDDRYRELERVRVIERDGGLILHIECDDTAAEDLRRRPEVVSVTPE